MGLRNLTRGKRALYRPFQDWRSCVSYSRCRGQAPRHSIAIKIVDCFNVICCPCTGRRTKRHAFDWGASGRCLEPCSNQCNRHPLNVAVHNDKLSSHLAIQIHAVSIDLYHTPFVHAVTTFICTDLARVSWSYPNLLKLTPRPLSLTPVHANAGSR